MASLTQKGLRHCRAHRRGIHRRRPRRHLRASPPAWRRRRPSFRRLRVCSSMAPAAPAAGLAPGRLASPTAVLTTVVTSAAACAFRPARQPPLRQPAWRQPPRRQPPLGGSLLGGSLLGGSLLGGSHLATAAAALAGMPTAASLIATFGGGGLALLGSTAAPADGSAPSPAAASPISPRSAAAAWRLGGVRSQRRADASPAELRSAQRRGGSAALAANAAPPA